VIAIQAVAMDIGIVRGFKPVCKRLARANGLFLRVLLMIKNRTNGIPKLVEAHRLV